MQYLAEITGQTPEAKQKAADDLVVAKEKELADAKKASAALGAPMSGTIDGVKTGGRRKRKTRRGGKKSKKSRRSRK